MSTQSVKIRDYDLEHGSAPAEYRRIYVWQIPVRVYHWINALAITLLCATGFLIGRPVRIAYGAEAWQQYWFGWVRFIHFAAAYAFLFNTLARLYWAFAGNKYAKWTNFLPITKKQIMNIVDVVMVDILQLKKHGEASTGHNSLAAFCYFFMFLLFIAQTVTGFALYASMSSSFVPHLFTWIVPILGSEIAVRWWHHLFLWCFVAFVVVHVWLSIYHDWVEGRGEISAMVSGWKFDRETPEGMARISKLHQLLAAGKKK
jgi:Ni/Fe-hydrogenase 1 B-type cytochrome subunit